MPHSCPQIFTVRMIVLIYSRVMLQQDKPSDYVVATGIGATVKDFVEASFARVGLNWQDHVEVEIAGDEKRITDWLGNDLATALGSEVEVMWLSPADTEG